MHLRTCASEGGCGGGRALAPMSASAASSAVLTPTETAALPRMCAHPHLLFVVDANPRMMLSRRWAVAAVAARPWSAPPPSLSFLVPDPVAATPSRQSNACRSLAQPWITLKRPLTDVGPLPLAPAVSRVRIAGSVQSGSRPSRRPPGWRRGERKASWEGGRSGLRPSTRRYVKVAVSASPRLAFSLVFPWRGCPLDELGVLMPRITRCDLRGLLSPAQPRHASGQADGPGAD